MTVKGDTFVESTDKALTSHTPTGANAGTSWVVQTGSGSATVRASTDDVSETNAGEGNRFRLSDDLGSDAQDVQGNVSVGGGSGDFIFPGIMARLPTGAGTTGIEFTYNQSNGVFELSDGTTSATATAAKPTAGALWRLLIDGSGVMIGYVGGTEVVRLTSNLKSGNTRAGFMLGNFSGTSGQNVVDNFQASSVSSAQLIPLTLSASQAQTVSAKRSAAVRRAITQASTVSTRRAASVRRALTQAQGVTLRRALALGPLSAISSTSIAVALGKSIGLALSFTQTATVTLRKSAVLPRTAQQAMYVTVKRVARITRTITQPTTVALKRALSHSIALTQAASVTLRRAATVRRSVTQPTTATASATAGTRGIVALIAAPTAVSLSRALGAVITAMQATQAALTFIPPGVTQSTYGDGTYGDGTYGAIGATSGTYGDGTYGDGTYGGLVNQPGGQTYALLFTATQGTLSRVTRRGVLTRTALQPTVVRVARKTLLSLRATVGTIAGVSFAKVRTLAGRYYLGGKRMGNALRRGLTWKGGR